MRTRFLYFYICSWALLCLCSRSLAQPLDSGAMESPAYREAISNALQEFELGNYAEAREQFRVAHELSPSARTLRGLGITEFELRNYPESVRLLEKALASGTKPLGGDMRKEAEAVLGRARGYVGELTIALEPQSAEVSVNGQPVALGSSPLLLPVGDHVLEFGATGYATQRRGITVKGRQKQTLTVELASLPSPGSDSSPASPERSPQQVSSRPSRWWIWTTVAVLAVGGGVAAGLLVRRARQTEYEYEPVRTAGTPTGFEDGLALPPPAN